MTHISLIDAAIKSFVEAPRKTGGRVVYTKEQLQSLRFSRIVREWPPSFDRRFSRSKFRKNTCLYPQLNRLSYCKSLTRVSDASRSDNDRSDAKKLLYLCDDAVVSAAVGDGTETRKDRGSESSFYDRPTLSFQALRSRQRFVKCSVNIPDWYVHGPRAVEEEMEISDCNMHDVGHSPASCPAKCLDDEKENASKPIIGDYKKFGHKAGSALQFQCQGFASDAMQNESERIGFRTERAPNVTTLREIESNLNIESENLSHKYDMSACYKLLGLVGKSTPDSLTHSVQGEDSFRRSADCRSTNNNQPHVTKCKLMHPTAELFNDPAVSNFVEKGQSICTDLSHESNPHILNAKAKLNMATQMACNPLTASYQRQMMASGPLGHNALRWFKAMTNAAAANACISQRVDGSATHLAAKESGENFSEVDSQERVKYNSSENPCQKPNEVDRQDEMTVSPVNQLYKPLFDWPFYFGSSRLMLDSAFGVGFNLSSRHLKPPMFYYHPQMMQFLSRPLVHPLILQQILQRQFSLRNPALQLPFNYLRTHVMMQLPFESNCSPTFQSSGGVENTQEPLIGPQTSVQPSFSPLIQEIHSTEQ